MFRNFLIAVVFALAIPTMVLAGGQGSITVKVTGLRNDKGVVRIALFNSGDSYTKSKGSAGNAAGAFQKGKAIIASGQANYTFEAVPYGDYAIKMFHDEDDSGNFQTGMFGIPKVEYGFSNNAHGRMGPAPYDKAKFTLNQPTYAMDIQAVHGM